MNRLSYQEMRVLIDDLVDAWPNPIAHRAIDEARMYVRTHYRACGARLPVADIEQQRAYCRACSGSAEYEQLCAIAAYRRV